ncbi:RIP metalloprotease RseP [Jeotgalibacillus proteolyticus]|uniref:Zinc metalloprotease n=1 Tax=Jeotgalibacillus proteolyticus TaxID=2082395 RepID=A0A2S5GG74_9BACL|nr:RIP metalloprotease RseP [Jeotgalibacillus proteolyticus]PPA72030.1 RIP metalloprotease RseP [Jeotgalibacillus proteolyticus]
MNTVIAFIIIFGALVFFHELGHFVFAKRAGILCREFAIGMGPKILAFKRNETQYTIRLLPIGGYVRMAGEDPEMVDLKPGFRVGLLLNQDETVQKMVVNNKDRYPNLRVVEVAEADIEKELYIKGYEEGEDQLQTYKIARDAVFVEDGVESQIAPWDRQFNSKKLSQRAMAIFAGPMMNFVLAFIVFAVIGLLQGVPTQEPELGELLDNGPAAQAGLLEGDRVQQIDGQEIDAWNDLTSVIQQHPNEEITMTVVRGEETLSINVTPEVQDIEGAEIGIIGVYSPIEKSPLKALSFGAEQTYFWTVTIFDLLGQLVTGQFTIDALSGPVGIYKSTEVVAQSGIYYLMRWGAILSINLGIMNLLPLPALDGGRLLFFGVEALRGKPIDRQKEGMVHFVGFALLMLLMIVVTWNDIQRFFLQ